MSDMIKILKIKDQINNLIKSRYKIENNEKNEKDFDNNEINIFNLIIDNKDDLNIDYIIETLTHLGRAPSIIYDDQGNFAISEDGWNNIRLESTDQFIASMIIEPEDFAESIREALNKYLDKYKNEIL